MGSPKEQRKNNRYRQSNLSWGISGICRCVYLAALVCSALLVSCLATSSCWHNSFLDALATFQTTAERPVEADGNDALVSSFQKNAANLVDADVDDVIASSSQTTVEKPVQADVNYTIESSIQKTAEKLVLQASVKRPKDCDQLSRQEIYDEHRRSYGNLKMKLLDAEDGAPSLDSKLPPRPREITVVTQASPDRWPQLEKMATSWGGAICVAVYVRTEADIAPAHEKMKSLHDRIEAQGQCRLHIQLVKEEGFPSDEDALAASYPINAVRNAATSMAKTELILILDADFTLSPGVHEKLTADENIYADLVDRASRKQLFVLSAFQTTPLVQKGVIAGNVESVDEPMPQSMQELRERWDNGSVTQFHVYYLKGHYPSNYTHFLNPLTTEPYFVEYKEGYEPYFIAARRVVPKFDERFRGYARDKIALAYHCAARGFKFVVLPGVYVWEIPHKKTESNRAFREKLKDKCYIDVMGLVYDIVTKELQLQIKSDKHLPAET